MIRWLRTVRFWLGRKSQERMPGLNKSRLVGMYLNRANSQDRGGLSVMGKRERSDGGFAQGRGR